MVRSEIFLPTTRELEYLFFLSRKAQFFFTEFNIRLYDKNSESDIFFPSTKIVMFLIFPETGVKTVQPVFLFGLCFSIFSFLCNIWEIIVYPFYFVLSFTFNMPLNCLSFFNLWFLWYIQIFLSKKIRKRQA